MLLSCHVVSEQRAGKDLSMTEMTFSLTDCEKEEVGGGGRL